MDVVLLVSWSVQFLFDLIMLYVKTSTSTHPVVPKPHAAEDLDHVKNGDGNFPFHLSVQKHLSCSGETDKVFMLVNSTSQPIAEVC